MEEIHMNRIMIITLLSVSLLAGIALAAEKKPEDLVKERQAAMVLIGKYFGPIELMSKNKMPFNAETVTRNLEYLDALAQMPWDGFSEATINIKSEALPAIYKTPDKFKKAAHDMELNITKLKNAKKKSPDDMKVMMEEAGKVCQFCHDKFREKKDDD